MEKLAPKVDTWNEVAKLYEIDLNSNDYKIAENIENMLREVGILPGATLIELGCGSGHISACLALRGYKVTLFDFSEVALDKARQTFLKYNIQAEFIQGDLMQLEDLNKHYDIAWNRGVMEHFGDTELENIIRNIAKITIKGIVCVTI